jgi:hypothetical protein
MAFKSGRLAEVSVATKLLGAYCNATDLDISIDNADTTTQGGTSWKTAISGLAGATLTLTGYYDPTVTVAPPSVLFAQIALNQAGTVTAIIYYPAGNNAGQGTSHTFNALLSNYKESPAVGNAVQFSCSLLATGADTYAQL